MRQVKASTPTSDRPVPDETPTHVAPKTTPGGILPHMDAEDTPYTMVSIMVMSGVDDGLVLSLDSESEGRMEDGVWVLSLGRREENDVCLRNDTFVSRVHGFLRLDGGVWQLVDNDSKNGTFLEDVDEDRQVTGTVPLRSGQLFRLGRTWLRLQADDA